MRKLNTEEFDELIFDEEEITAVFFHRNGCRICEELSGLLEELEENNPNAVFAEVDVEAEKELFLRFGMKGVPQVMFFANGDLVKTLSGRKDDEEYEQAIELLLGE